MKEKIAILFLLFIFNSNLYSQGLDKVLYGGCNEERLREMFVQGPNIYTAGYSNSFSWGSGDLYVCKVDTSGNVIWGRFIYQNDFEKFYSMINTYDNKLMVFEHRHLYKLDSTGSCEYNKYIGLNSIRFIQTWDKGFLFVGNETMKTDSLLHVEDVRTYEGSHNFSTYSTILTSVVETSDSGNLALGFMRDAKDYLLIIRSDKYGNLLWFKEYQKRILYNGPNEYSVIIPDVNNTFILAGLSDWHKLFVMKIDDVGDIIWSKTYDCDLGGSWSHMNITKGISNGYLVTGNRISFYDSSSAFVMSIDSTGDPLWANVYSDGKSALADKAVVLGNSYLIGGSSSVVNNPSPISNQTDMMLFRVDSNGNSIVGHQPITIYDSTQVEQTLNRVLSVIPFYPSLWNSIVADDNPAISIATTSYDSLSCLNATLSVNIPDEADGLIIYPNPLSDKATITLPEGHNNITINMYSSIGELVRSTSNISSDRFILERKNLTSGLYIVRILDGNELVGRGKIVVE